MKTSFILHLDSLAVLDDLTSEQAGNLFKAIHHFQKTSELPQLDLLLKVAISPFINQFLRDKEAYQKVIERNKKNGEKGGRPLKTKKKNPKNPVGYSETQDNPDKPKKPDSDNDSESDSDNVTPKGVVGSGASAPPQPKNFKQWNETEFYHEIGRYKATYSKDTLRAFYDYWREKTANGKMRFQLEQTWETDLRLATWQRREDEKKPPAVIKHLNEASKNNLPAYIKKLNG